MTNYLRELLIKSQSDDLYQKLNVPVEIYSSDNKLLKTYYLPEQILIELDRDYYTIWKSGKFEQSNYSIVLADHELGCETVFMKFIELATNEEFLLRRTDNVRLPAFALNKTDDVMIYLLLYRYGFTRIINDHVNIGDNIIQNLSTIPAVILDDILQKIKRTNTVKYAKILNCHVNAKSMKLNCVFDTYYNYQDINNFQSLCFCTDRYFTSKGKVKIEVSFTEDTAHIDIIDANTDFVLKSINEHTAVSMIKSVRLANLYIINKDVRFTTNGSAFDHQISTSVLYLQLTNYSNVISYISL